MAKIHQRKHRCATYQCRCWLQSTTSLEQDPQKICYVSYVASACCCKTGSFTSKATCLPAVYPLEYGLSLKSLLHTSCVQVSSSQPRQQRRCAPLFQRSGEVVVKISLRWKTLGKWDINGICAINQHHSIWRQKNKLK